MLALALGAVDEGSRFHSRSIGRERRCDDDDDDDDDDAYEYPLLSDQSTLTSPIEVVEDDKSRTISSSTLSEM
jgi:hypothetical protein